MSIAAGAVLVACGSGGPREAATTTTADPKAGATAATCEAALVPARQFMAGHPAGTVMTPADGVRIRQLFAEAYNHCPAAEIERVKNEELFPWVESLELPDGYRTGTG